MAKMDPDSYIASGLSLLEDQEKENESVRENSASLKDHFLSLKLGLSFLKELLYISQNEGLILRIKRVVYEVSRELQSMSNKRDGSLVLDLDHAYTSLRKKMMNVILKPENRKYGVVENVISKPETREYDVIFPSPFIVMGFFNRTRNFILKSFGDLSSCKPDVISPSIEVIEEFKEKLILLQASLPYLDSYITIFAKENEKILRTHVTLLEEATCLLYSCSVEKMDKDMEIFMKKKLSNLLENMKVKEIYMVVLETQIYHLSIKDPLESEFCLLNNLIRLLDCNAAIVYYLNDPSEKLYDILKDLRAFLVDLPLELRLEKFNYLVTSIADIAREAIPVFYSIHIEEMKEDMAREVNEAVSVVLDKFMHIQAEVKEIKLYNYPKTDEWGFIDLFSIHLEELVKCQPESLQILKDQTDTLRVGFNVLRSFLRNIKEKHNEHEELEHLWTRFVHFAYRAEHVIDFYMVNNAADRRVELALSIIIEEMELLKSEATRINDQKYRAQAHDVAKIASHVPLHVTPTTTDEVVVGFEDEAEKIMDDTTGDEMVGFKDEAERIMEYLFEGSKQLDVVSIVGMPGLGKTTLAKKMYEDPSKHFHTQAWCTVSQTYRKRELLLNLLGDLIAVTQEIQTLNDEELAAQLCKTLRGRRYLIVIDDLWDIEAWHDLVRCFPEDQNHSRILITSRHLTAVSHTKVHSLRQFSDVESLELLQKKLLQTESFSREFLKVGEQIAKRCNGLPLAVVVIAGLLAKVERSVSKWNQIAESLSSHILRNPESPFKAILELLYNHMPDHLRACFLYIGSFPRDKEISVWKLKLLLIAEGFIKDTEQKSLDDLSDEYLMDLINRSLVTTSKERSNGGPKACRVHDILHDFCLEKSKEERFLQVIHADDVSKFSRVYDNRRLRIFSKVDDLIKAEPFGCSVRTLLHIATDEVRYCSDLSWISQNLKLLRVLDLACITIGNSFDGIELLIHLRYLAVVAEKISIPPSIVNLWNLQSFLVNPNSSYNKEVVEVPDSLWDMVNLKHVHINSYAAFELKPNRLEKSSSFETLETFSTPCFSNKEDAENLLRRLPKLQKLRCVYLEDCWDDSTNCYQFPALDFLSQLMSLKVFFKRSSYVRKKCEFILPSKLEKLTLSDVGVLWDDILKYVRTLPSLKVLKLNGSDWSETWNVNDDDFPKLKFLKLSKLTYICDWTASEGAFPNLEHLVLENCRDLKEIPSSFEGMPTLRTITVKGCKPSVDDSARRIQMAQEEWGNEIKLFIYPRKLEILS